MTQANEQNNELDIFSDEVKFLDLWNVVKNSYKAIIYITILFSLASIVYAFTLPPVFKVSLSMIPSKTPSASAISQSTGAFGSFANLAGIKIPQSIDNVETSLAVLKSRVFLEGFLERNNIISILYSDDWDSGAGKWKDDSPKMWSAVNSFRSLMTVRRDLNSGVIDLSMEWNDPEIAAFWANQMIDEINTFLKDEVISEGELNLVYLEEQLGKTNSVGLESVIFGLMSEQTKNIMLANVSKDYAFKVLDPAVVPLERISPRRKVIAILGFILGIFLGLVYAFSISFYTNLRTVGSLKN